MKHPHSTKWRRRLLFSVAACWAGAAPAWAGNALPPLPLAVASFGAAVAADHLFVYGGHVGQTHQHSIENLSSRFLSLDLSSPTGGWKELEAVPALQGLALVAHGPEVCRLGGLSARNHQGEEEDLVSVADVACFHAQNGTWRHLPPLPSPRSSHDAVVIGDRLIVVGGWQLAGRGQSPRWHDTVAELDLAAVSPTWKTTAQPFGRRALAVAAANGKVYALGGMAPEGTSRRVDVYDPTSGTWEEGPELPEIEGPMRGFGLAAIGDENRVLAAGADGKIYVLAAESTAWREAPSRLATPRFFHRLALEGGKLWVVGGASRAGGHLESLEHLALSSLESPTTVAAAAPASWPAFRGDGSGHTEAKDLPLRWSESENLAWRAKLPGFGQSSPVVWGDQVFVTSVEGPKKEWLIASALDLKTGEVRWRRRFATSLPLESTEMVSRAAPTPAVDGERLFLFWESGDLFALDLEGETLWHRALATEYGAFEGNHGLGSSLVLAGDAVVVQVTHAGPSYVLAIDRATGKNLWKADRPPGVAWTTPVVAQGSAGLEILVSAAGRLEALDAGSGEVHWLREGIEKNTVASAVVGEGRVVVASSEPGQSLMLLGGGQGALGDERVGWRTQGVSSGFGSPLLVGGCALFANRAGVLTCLDLASGEERWTRRLPEAAWASPIAAEGLAFFFTKKGATEVLRIRREGAEVVAENLLPTADTVYGVAAVPGAFLVRSGTELVRIGLPQALRAAL